MSRSSIFNFESFTGFRPHLPRALLFTVGFVAVIELTARLLPEGCLDGSRIVTEIRFMEKNLLPRIPNPRILVLGSSRVRRGVVPGALDRELGLPPHSTINAGMAMGRTYDALYFYQRNRAQLSRSRLIILTFDEWTFCPGLRMGAHYELNAPWSDRLQHEGVLRSRMVMDGLFQFRVKLPRAPEELLFATGLRRRPVHAIEINDDHQVLPPEREKNDPEAARRQMKEFYTDFSISPVLCAHVLLLARLIKEDGGQLVLMHLPNRDSYQNAVERDYPGEFQSHLSALQDVARQAEVPLFIFTRPGPCGLDDGCYLDYGHLNRAGSLVFTKFLADLIRKQAYLH